MQIAILGVGAYLVLQQELTSGASIAGSIIMGRALAPVEQMIGGWKQLVQARQSFRRLQILPGQPRLRPPGLPLPEPTGQLSVERVSYAFPGQGVAMIKGVNFALAPGESLAVIGPSAAGKTTLIRLLIGTLPASAGTVRLDGADVYQWLREDFGRHVGYLPQDVELFDGTVVRQHRPHGARPSRRRSTRPPRLAGCHEMILRLPNGYETEIGEGGQYLSGGQRQLIGLARAMFGRPKLVVLDEPNSNLDGDSEAALTAALERLKEQGTTVVLVSHRPTLVQGVDKVLLLKDGAMEMFGPRAEVLKRLMAPPRPAEAPAGTDTDAAPGRECRPMTATTDLPAVAKTGGCRPGPPPAPGAGRWCRAAASSAPPCRPSRPTRCWTRRRRAPAAPWSSACWSSWSSWSAASAWAVLAPLAEASIAPGVIKVEGNRRTIQHLEGGIVREILVRDGSKVKAGDADAARRHPVGCDAGNPAGAALGAAGAGCAADRRDWPGAARSPSRPTCWPAPIPRAMDSVTGQRALFEARTASLQQPAAGAAGPDRPAVGDHRRRPGPAELPPASSSR